MRASFYYNNQYLENISPVFMRISGRSSFIFMTTVDEEDGASAFCQERNVRPIRRQNARARAMTSPLVI